MNEITKDFEVAEGIIMNKEYDVFVYEFDNDYGTMSVIDTKHFESEKEANEFGETYTVTAPNKMISYDVVGSYKPVQIHLSFDDYKRCEQYGREKADNIRQNEPLYKDRENVIGRYRNGQMGEVAVGKFIGINFADFTIGRNENYNRPDIPFLHCGVKTIVKGDGKLHVINNNCTYDQILCIVDGLTVEILGVATQDILNEYVGETFTYNKNKHFVNPEIYKHLIPIQQYLIDLQFYNYAKMQDLMQKMSKFLLSNGKYRDICRILLNSEDTEEINKLVAEWEEVSELHYHKAQGTHYSKQVLTDIITDINGLLKLLASQYNI